jgi:hypothetical protein
MGQSGEESKKEIEAAASGEVLNADVPSELAILP